MTGTLAPIELSGTGRQLVLLSKGAGREAAETLRNVAGIRLTQAHPAAGEGLLFDRLDAALVHGDPDQARALQRFAQRHGLIVEPERPLSGRGRVPLQDTARATWGLKATGVLASRYSGRGVRVAILDTGLDLQHPDFSHRAVRSRSFIAGLSVHDRNGHGTCCAGIACGPDRPRRGSRYGVASGADLYVAKVLDDEANGSDGTVIAGIDWAVRKGCPVIAISLGTPASQGGSYSRVYERIASRALAAGSLLVAPAGNASQRPDLISPVEHPANCPSVLAVGALNQSLTQASFSNGSPDSRSRGVDVLGPGTAVRSSAPRPTLYQVASGTSIAVPFVAGIAALYAEACPGARGAALRTLLLESARRSVRRAGGKALGFVHAP